MSYTGLLLAGFFLPLFPLSMAFNLLYARVRHPVLRGLFLLAWPQVGSSILFALGVTVPAWLVAWALATSLMYALRALVLRELGLWTSFVATSAWGLLWILQGTGASHLQMQLLGLGISAPLVLMAFLVSALERRFGAAYLGLYGGLAQSVPRFTGVLVVVVLAVVATPMFPGFFAMLAMITKTLPANPVIAFGVGAVWLLWSWAGARLLQGLITGPERLAVADLSQANMWLSTTFLAGLMFTGVYFLGAMV
jgi:NADH:ubiquinone oxidoreductase subunit 4 (subunit M)